MSILLLVVALLAGCGTEEAVRDLGANNDTTAEAPPAVEEEAPPVEEPPPVCEPDKIVFGEEVDAPGCSPEEIEAERAVRAARAEKLAKEQQTKAKADAESARLAAEVRDLVEALKPGDTLESMDPKASKLILGTKGWKRGFRKWSVAQGTARYTVYFDDSGAVHHIIDDSTGNQTANSEA